MSEFDFIHQVRQKAPCFSHTVVGIGDDTAAVSTSACTLITTDMLLDKVHFDLRVHSPREIGHKCLAVNLSDIAAMAGTPRAATISLAIPKDMDQKVLHEIMAGIYATAEQYHTSIVGGDTNSWSGPFAISIALMGEPHPKGLVQRCGAQLGDAICVTGVLGQSYPTGHHLRFQPRLDCAQQLLADFDIHAMIDISDGLAGDLQHILQQSCCGAQLELSRLPLRGADGSVQHALYDGEDFELCFTLPVEQAESLGQRCNGVAITAIGRIVEGAGLYGRYAASEPWSALEPGGYRHEF